MALANGTVLPNRLVKAAMEGNVAGTEQLPDGRMRRLYQRSAQVRDPVIST